MFTNSTRYAECLQTVLDILMFKNSTRYAKWSTLLKIHAYTFLVCLFVRLYQINVKTANPIGLKFSFPGDMWNLTTPKKSDECWKLQIKCLLKIFAFRKNFITRTNPQKILFFCFFDEFLLKDWETIKSWNRRWVRNALIA